MKIIITVSPNPVSIQLATEFAETFAVRQTARVDVAGQQDVFLYADRIGMLDRKITIELAEDSVQNIAHARAFVRLIEREQLVNYSIRPDNEDPELPVWETFKVTKVVVP